VTASARSVCKGFVWVGQSVLCCDECGSPWFLHPGDYTLAPGSMLVLGSGAEWIVKPFPERRQAQVPNLVAAWEANALWQAERGAWWPGLDGRDGQYAPNVERQVGKDFPYPTGPTRPAS